MSTKRRDPSNHYEPEMEYLGEVAMASVREDLLRSWPAAIKAIGVADLIEAWHTVMCGGGDDDSACWQADRRKAEALFEAMPKIELWLRQHRDSVLVAAKQYRHYTQSAGHNV